jgi:hypothetical protein
MKDEPSIIFEKNRFAIIEDKKYTKKSKSPERVFYPPGNSENDAKEMLFDPSYQLN